MAFNRFDDRRSTYNFEKTPSRGRTFLKNAGNSDQSGGGSGESPFLRRKPLLNGVASVPSSVASSRESSLDRGGGPSYVNGRPPGELGMHLHNVVGRVMSSPKMSLRKKFQVMRSGSFNEAKSTLDNKRKKWLLERSGSLRLPGKYKPKVQEESPWSSPEADRRGSLPMSPPQSPRFRDGSLDRRGSYHPHELHEMDSGKVKGFVNRWFRHITEASNAYRARDTRGRGQGLYPADPINNNGLEGSGGDRSKTEVDRLDVESALDKKGQPAGRSQSFHEQSTSSREPHPERQPSSPPEERPELSSSAKKAEKIRRKDQEVARALEEKHRLVAEYYHLPFDDELNPPATPVSAGPMSAAASIDEVTSGGERDAREVLLAALVQVKSLSDLVNESLTLSEEDAVAAASVATSSRLSPSGSASTSPHQQTTTATSTSPTPTMATATGTTTTAFPRLSSLASEVIDDLPSVKLLKRLHPPTHKLIAITKSMNHHLTSLLEIIQDRDEERDRLRKEVHRMRAMLPRESAASSGSMRPSLSAAAATTGPGSRPVSFISIEESSGPETTSASERNQESEDDGAASNRSPTQVHPTVSENIGEDVASVERIIETTIASQDVEANPEQPPSQIGPGNTSPTTFKVPKTEANVSSNDEPEDETSEVMVENTEDDSAV